MPKSPDAFRTISEVADWLGIQAHVLRFWESKFTQVKPIKRAGGRRYYRPVDMQLLGGIRKLLHDDGLTIKGVQKILREEGMSFVAALSEPLDDADAESYVSAPAAPPPRARKAPEPEQAVVLPFEMPKESQRPAEKAKIDKETKAMPSPVAPPEQDSSAEGSPQHDDTHVGETTDASELMRTSTDTPADAGSSDADSKDAVDAPEPEPAVDTAPVAEEQTVDAAVAEKAAPALEEEAATKTWENEEAEQSEPSQDSDAASKSEIAAKVEPEIETGTTDDENTAAEDPEDAAPSESVETAELMSVKTEIAPLPSFLRKPVDEPAASSKDTSDDDGDPAPDQSAEPSAPSKTPEPEPTKLEDSEVAATEDAQPIEAPRPKARDIGMPDITPEGEIPAQPAALSYASRMRQVDPATAQKLQPLVSQLAALRDRMAARTGGAHPKS
ncbi:MerR family transcriptional regulator [Sulfitobacter guttiformis]|uniref:DNA-binding transcriptional MerR regulator n=1 Tax=Sulfitobacter guttiformis TaxID=74349 RepID=A0A420DMW5_9RHOB|nr:MerR family transcriptional regulator [Sulfitobacter guttiformis]RKE95540.1 DNA-binding transcriptional MerR regulator [Sulfitobacter guttiformis]